MKPHRSAFAIVALAGASLLAGTYCAPAKSTAVHYKPEHAASATAKTDRSAAARPIKKKQSGEAATGSRDKHKESRQSAGPPEALPDISATDVALVRKAIDSLNHGSADSATQTETAISDPAARKLVEWMVLRSGNRFRSTRYLAFIAANPDWPSLSILRRFAEEMLWVEDHKPSEVVSFFNEAPPQTARGRLTLARALAAQGDSDGAHALVRTAWRDDSMTAELEQQVPKAFPDVLTRADDKARMERRIGEGDREAAMRAAHRLGSSQVEIARARLALNAARIALVGKSVASKAKSKGKESSKENSRENSKQASKESRKENGKESSKQSSKETSKDGKPPERGPAEAQDDPGYMLLRAHLQRRQEKVAQAAQTLISAPSDTQADNPEEWWVERRILARKLLDIGDPYTAYRVVRDAAEPIKENSRVESHFMAGWIALRYLNDPGAAQEHFAHIQDVDIHPTSLARSHYWLARTAEALHQPDRARAEYAAAAQSSAAYYGQLARARLGLGRLALAPAQARSGGEQRGELVRALDILYALHERLLAISFMANVGRSIDDVGTLAALGNLAEERQDARGMLHLGKAALARGLPLEYHAFPTVGVPAYSPIGPRIDTALVFAIIRQESAFDPADFSAAHAMGLMQVTPEAGRDTCKRFGCNYDGKRLKDDSPYNLQLGAAELGGVLEEYGGNHILAFAAYNAGRGRVQEWIKTFGDPRDPRVDPVDWVERIPFMETRNYVQRVMENMQVYRARFAADAPLTIERDLRGKTAAAH